MNYFKKNQYIYDKNSPIISISLIKTRSSSNNTVVERNSDFMHFMSKNQEKTKISSKKSNNETKERPKSNDYIKPKMEVYNKKK